MVLNKFIPISFLVIYLFSATELNQLVKVPMLVEHFNEHKTQNTEITFCDFLFMHYCGHDANDNDYDKDMKLPFKSHDGHAGFNAVAYMPSRIHFVVKPVFRETKTFNNHYEKFFTSVDLSCIWQPPKTC